MGRRRLDGGLAGLYHLGAEVALILGALGEVVVGGDRSALVVHRTVRGCHRIRGTGLPRSESEPSSFCLLLKPRANCNLRNFKHISGLE
jgi:hypothetical protein